MKKTSDNSGYKKLKKDISNNEPANMYLFWGEESYLREYYLDSLKKLVLPRGLEEFNYKRFAGKNVDPALLEGAIDTLPVFSERSIVEVRDFDFYKAAGDKRDKIAEIVADLPDYCILVFVFTDPSFKPDGRTKVHTAIKNKGVVVQFEKQEQSDLARI